jgi:hypothetical protein
MGAPECRGKPTNAVRAKGVEKEEEEEDSAGHRKLLTQNSFSQLVVRRLIASFMTIRKL